MNLTLAAETHPPGTVLDPGVGGIMSLQLVAGPAPEAWLEPFSLVDVVTGRELILFHPGAGHYQTGRELISRTIPYRFLQVGHIPKGASLALAY